MPREPAAFMSYVRFDDQHDDGQLTQFRERLAAEVRAQTGTEFAIFQDRNDIAWGQNWQQRIDQTLDAVTLLLIIVTPSLFHSPACRDEFEKFQQRERALGRSDLILPVYYIGAPVMDDPETRGRDEMARVLGSRQHADWRELRFEPFTSPVVRRAIAQLASRLRDTFWQSPPVSAVTVGSAKAPASPTASTSPTTTQRSEGQGEAVQVSAKSEPPTHVVDPYHRGDFVTVTEAIRAAHPGDRILVRPGLYDEGLVVDKPLEILGDGPVSDIVIRAREADALLFKAAIGRVANLTLQQAGGQGTWYGVDITQGRLDLEGCDINSQSLACIAIRNGADPRLRRNQIHDSPQASGVFVYDGGLGTLEDNDITGTGLSGVEIKAGGNPTFRRNQIHDNKESGVYVNESGLGTLEDNDITGNRFSGVAIRAGGNPTFRRNQIHDNQESGVFVYDGGLGTLEDNDITGNSRAGVEIAAGGNLTVKSNRINRNAHAAVRVSDGGRGVIVDNDLRENRRGAWDIAPGSEAAVERSGNRE